MGPLSTLYRAVGRYIHTALAPKACSSVLQRTDHQSPVLTPLFLSGQNHPSHSAVTATSESMCTWHLLRATACPENNSIL